MKLTAQVKLLPTDTQRVALLATMERINAACDAMSARAWTAEVFSKRPLQKLVYHETKAKFGLTAQVVIRAIAKVSDAYALDHNVMRAFRPHGAVAYDSRILRWSETSINIWTLAGRQTIPFVCGERQFNQLHSRDAEADLVYRDGEFYLFAGVEVPDKPLVEIEGILGIDLGIVNIAADSDGKTHSGKHLNRLRDRHRRQRRRLQEKGTKSAKRLLKKRRKKESRFANDVNHRIAKSIVATAIRTKRGIALEDLKGILQRVRARKPQRSRLHSWAFKDLGDKISYKAKLAGIPVFFIDPRNTSRECPECGCIDKHNRPTRDTFCCVACGCAGPADTIAAVNIGRRAAVNRPYAGVSTRSSEHHTLASLAL